MPDTRHGGSTKGIACANFSESELNGLRSLLALVRPYLRQEWEITSPERGDVVLVNLDEPGASLPEDRRHVGCAQKPRLHREGTLHRPLRVAELLSLLSDIAARQDQAGQPAAGALDPEFSYSLRAWPLDFERWPRESWPVLALLSHGHHSTRDIAARTGCPQQVVGQTVAQLLERNLLDRHGERLQMPAHQTNGPKWRGLAARVGQLFGFSA